MLSLKIIFFMLFLFPVGRRRYVMLSISNLSKRHDYLSSNHVPKSRTSPNDHVNNKTTSSRSNLA